MDPKWQSRVIPVSLWLAGDVFTVQGLPDGACMAYGCAGVWSLIETSQSIHSTYLCQG